MAITYFAFHYQFISFALNNFHKLFSRKTNNTRIHYYFKQVILNISKNSIFSNVKHFKHIEEPSNDGFLEFKVVLRSRPGFS